MKEFDKQIVKRLLLEYYNASASVVHQDILTDSQKAEALMEVDEQYANLIIEALSDINILS